MGGLSFSAEKKGQARGGKPKVSEVGPGLVRQQRDPCEINSCDKAITLGPGCSTLLSCHRGHPAVDPSLLPACLLLLHLNPFFTSQPHRAGMGCSPPLIPINTEHPARRERFWDRLCEWMKWEEKGRPGSRETV